MIDAAIDKLAALSPPKPWMSTKALSRTLSLSPARTFELLHEEARRADRRLRYCMYPSRRDLDVLWGHVSIVGERNLHPLTRENLPEEFLSGREQATESVSEARLFLSHTIRDFSDVYQLRDRLEASGQKVWIFEDDMPPSVIIHTHIQEILENSSQFGVYLTQQFLGSVYGDKEVEQIESFAARKPVTVFFNSTSEWVIETAIACFEATPEYRKEVVKSAVSQNGGQNDRDVRLIERLVDLILSENSQLIFHNRGDVLSNELPEVCSNPIKRVDIIQRVSSNPPASGSGPSSQ